MSIISNNNQVTASVTTGGDGKGDPVVPGVPTPTENPVPGNNPVPGALPGDPNVTPPAKPVTAPQPVPGAVPPGLVPDVVPTVPNVKTLVPDGSDNDQLEIDLVCEYRGADSD